MHSTDETEIRAALLAAQAEVDRLREIRATLEAERKLARKAGETVKGEAVGSKLDLLLSLEQTAEAELGKAQERFDAMQQVWDDCADALAKRREAFVRIEGAAQGLADALSAGEAAAQIAHKKVSALREGTDTYLPFDLALPDESLMQGLVAAGDEAAQRFLAERPAPARLATPVS